MFMMACIDDGVIFAIHSERLDDGFTMAWFTMAWIDDGVGNYLGNHNVVPRAEGRAHDANT